MPNDPGDVNGAERDVRFSRIFQLLPDAVMLARVDDSAVLEVNEAFEKLTGYGADALVGRPALSFFSFLDTDLWARVWSGTGGDDGVVGLETRLLRKDGQVAFVRMSMRRTEIDGVPCNLATLREIPGDGNRANGDKGWCGEVPCGLERLVLPEAVVSREDVGRLIDFRALQDLVNSFYRITGIAVAITDLNGNVQVATGWQDICTRFHRMHPETLANCRESDTCLTRNIGEGAYALYKCKNGMWDMATPIVIGGRRIANLFLGQFLFDDEVPDYGFFRKQAEKYGFDPGEYLAALDRVPRWSRELIDSAMEFYTKLALLISRLSFGNISLSHALAEQKKAEDELLLYKYCIDNAGIGIYQTFEKHIYNVNECACKSLRYSADELRAMTVFDIDPAITMDRMHEIRQMLEATGSVTHQSMHRRKDGTVFPVEITANQVEFNGKQYAISFVKDITDRKLAEEALRESEEKFRVLAETSPAAVTLYQGEKIVYINPAAAKLLGYTVEELSQVSFWNCIHEDFKEMVRERGFARLRGEDVPSRYQCKLVTKEGRDLWVMLSVGRIEFKGRPAGIATLVDMTEAKNAEERIRASLEEKNVLLKEIHHRVKNNLQIISSLLDLQSDFIRGETIREYFRDSQDRIRSMALIHQKLYQSESLAFVDFRDYLEELATNLFASFAREPHLIQLNVDVDEVLLCMDEAIPCGLIMNELVSNSLKHAFPGGRSGKITIRCNAGDDGWIALSVSDTGVGLPAGFDFRNAASLGLQLVSLLAKQLGGRVKFSGEQGGTVAAVTFPSAAACEIRLK